MAKIQILQLSTTSKKKNGEPIANNKLKVGIKTLDANGNEQWINGFVPIGSLTWKVGDTVDLEITNDEKWGLQFTTPEGMVGQPTEDNLQRINEIDNRLRKVELQLKSIIPNSAPEQPLDANSEPNNTTPAPIQATSGDGLEEFLPERQEEEEIKTEDIPF